MGEWLRREGQWLRILRRDGWLRIEGQWLRIEGWVAK
jgi:hypothetical protein